MRTLLAFGFIIFISTHCLAQFFPGSSYAEKKLMLSWLMMRDTIYSCFHLKEKCGLNKEEQDTFLKIKDISDRGLNWNLIKVVSGRKNPGLFDVKSGPHRLAVTGNKPNSTIYFNKDILDTTPDITLEELVSILFHELGHHTGLTDTEDLFLESFGGRMAKHYSRNIQKSPPLTGPGKNIEILIFNHLNTESQPAELGKPKLGTLARLYVLDGVNIAKLDERLPRLTNCYYGSIMNQLWLNGLRWNHSKSTSNSQQIHASASEVHFCHSKKFIGLRVTGRLSVSMNLAKDSTGFLRLAELPSIRLDQVDRGHIESNWSRRNFLFSDTTTTRITLKSVSTNTSKIVDGGTWKINTTFKSQKEIKPWFCSLIIGSNDFNATYGSGSKYNFESNKKDCQLVKLGTDSYKVEASYTFPKDTPNRKYYIRAISITDNSMNTLLGIPKYRQEIAVSSTSKMPPLANMKTLIRGDKKKEVTSKALGYVDSKWCQRFQVAVDLNSQSPLKQAHLTYRINYAKNKHTPIKLTERISHPTDLPWKAISKLKGSSRQEIEFDLYFVHEFLEPEKFDKIDFLRMSILLENLQELIIDFPDRKFGLNSQYLMKHCGRKN